MGNCFTKEPPVTNPFKIDVVVPLTGTEVRQIVQSVVGETNTLITLSDDMYMCLEKKEIESWLASDPTDYKKYKKEIRDCDDFARILEGKALDCAAAASDKEMGFCFGIIKGDLRKSEDDNERRSHAMNCFIDNEKRFWLIEPQTDKIIEYPKNSTATWVWI